MSCAAGQEAAACCSRCSAMAPEQHEGVKSRALLTPPRLLHSAGREEVMQDKVFAQKRFISGSKETRSKLQSLTATSGFQNKAVAVFGAIEVFQRESFIFTAILSLSKHRLY